MDEQVKRRLMGAGILSILAVIIVPYFFEDKAPKTATELPLPVESKSLALPKDEVAAVEKPQADAPVSQAPQTPASKKRAYTVVPLEDPKAPPAQATAASEDVAQAPVAEDYPEEPVTEGRGPVILDPKAPQAKPPLTPKLQHPVADVPPPRVASDSGDRTKAQPKKPEALKPLKPVVPPVVQAAEAPAKKPSAPPQEPQKKPASPAAVAAQSPKAPATPATPPKPGTPSSYLVQAGTFSDENNAKALVEKLKKRSLPVRMQVVEGLNGKVYRVTVGPNLDHTRAEQIQKQLSEQDGVRGLILQGH